MSQQKKILLVEDNEAILRANKRLLEIRGFQVITAKTLAQARARLAEGIPDAIVLDIMLPDGSGMRLCKELRAKVSPPVPILFLSALGDVDNVVSGLRAGGNDYLTKPYHYEELVARIEGLLHHSEQVARAAVAEHRRRQLGPLSLDLDRRYAYLDDEEVQLTPKEFDLLRLLVDREGTYVSAEEINRVVWDREPTDDARTIYVHLSGLRRKLHLHPDARLNVEHMRNQGYRLYQVWKGEDG